MIHSRLRRSFRLAVVHLSSHFAGSSVGYRFLHLPLRGNSAGAAFILHRPVLLALPRLPHFVAERIPWFKHRVHPRTRRYLASSALLIALSLEVCGCDPAEDDLYTLNGTLTAATLSPSDPPLSFYDPPQPSAESSLPLIATGDLPLTPLPAPVEAKPLPWAISESVYFIYRSRPITRSGQRPDALRPHQLPIASAFVVSVPDLSHHGFDRFLVTARHVVDPQWADCSDQNPASIDLRLNRRNGGVGYETIALISAAGRRFLTPADPTVDIAIIPLDQSLIPNLDDYRIIDIPFRLLPTNAEIELIHSDQQIMTAKPSGGPGSYPVSESGSLSKMPAEPVSVQCGLRQSVRAPAKPLHVWFISAGVHQEVSGAPVYASIARSPGATRSPILLGIQSVAWPDRGAAGITPSPALGDLIQSTLLGRKLNLDFYQGPNP